jgi:hypothetical protein
MPSKLRKAAESVSLILSSRLAHSFQHCVDTAKHNMKSTGATNLQLGSTEDHANQEDANVGKQS